MLGRRTLVCVALWLAAAATPVGARDSPLPDGPGVVTLAELPAEAVATLETIRRGGPFRYRKDGVVFGNRERLLPRQPRGYYTEYTVRTPGSRDRGARRIVAGGDPKTSGEFYYTDDHYRSFRRIRE